MTNIECCKRIANELAAIYNGKATTEDGETATIWDYLDDVLDFEFAVNRDKTYKSAKIWVTLGGPNIWIDTEEKAVKLAWGSEREEYPLKYEVVEEIDDCMNEIYCNL